MLRRSLLAITFGAVTAALAPACSSPSDEDVSCRSAFVDTTGTLQSGGSSQIVLNTPDVYRTVMTMDQLARAFQTPRSTIARRVAEARTAILESTEALLREDKKLSPSAVASVIRQARSQLHVTLSRVLK